jgi:prepilin-type N-terminal cleavage/methylation domain-containing protein
MIQSSFRRGFTLIELLVVIAIIGLLSSIILAGLTNARVQARDTKRISDFRQIKIALEEYYQDHGYYPASDCGWNCNGYRYSFTPASWNALAADLAPYISLPTDSVNNCTDPWIDNCYSYTYGNVTRANPDGYPDGYDLTTQFENQSSQYRCGVKNYKWYFYGTPWCAAFGGSYSNYNYEAGTRN